MKIEDIELIEFVYDLASGDIVDEWFENVISKEWYCYVEKLPVKLKTTYLIGILNMQVNNGGLNQYFINGYGQFVLETIECLNAIGSYEIGELLKKAFQNINKQNFQQDEFRRYIIKGDFDCLYDNDELDELLTRLDAEFDTHQEAMIKNLATYIRS